MIEPNYLVADRECGSCTACCTYLAIQSDGLNKPPGVACRHVTECQGCGIYTERPAVCQSYHCLWRRLDSLGDEWRPDRSGTFLHMSDEQPQLKQRSVTLIFTGASEAGVSDQLAALVTGFVDSGIETYLNHQRGPNLVDHQMLLNPILRPALAERDLAKVRQLILLCYRELKAKPAVTAVSFKMVPKARLLVPRARP